MLTFGILAIIILSMSEINALIKIPDIAVPEITNIVEDRGYDANAYNINTASLLKVIEYTENEPLNPTAMSMLTVQDIQNEINNIQSEQQRCAADPRGTCLDPWFYPKYLKNLENALSQKSQSGQSTAASTTSGSSSTPGASFISRITNRVSDALSQLVSMFANIFRSKK